MSLRHTNGDAIRRTNCNSLSWPLNYATQLRVRVIPPFVMFVNHESSFIQMEFLAVDFSLLKYGFLDGKHEKVHGTEYGVLYE